MGLILGMDTGGTFTDAVLLDQNTQSVIKKAKAPTTKDDLCIGIRESIEALDYEKLSDVGLVCLSTTLATNAIVEGKGCRVGLIVTGKMPIDELPQAEIVNVGGSLDIKGRLQRDLNEDSARNKIKTLKNKVDAIAISGYACVRNPEHELALKKITKEELDVPVVCAHELTSELGYSERTVTVVLNARLIPLIKRLIDDTRICLEEKGIKVPIMMVRGDGSYMDSHYAIDRPVETILSGPAASIKGAMFLSNLNNGTVIDVGGTTLDIAVLKDGKVGISMNGAQVGGWKTCVKAIDVFTCGIGGDSCIRVSSEGDIKIGPDKVIPLSYAASHGMREKIEIDELTSTDKEYRNIFGLSESFNEIGLTPTDLAHIIGIYDAWDRSAAQECLNVLADQLDLEDADLLERLSGAFREYVLNALEESGKTLPESLVVALGAPSETWMPIILKDTHHQLIVPEHSEVANAIGAAIGEIEEVVRVLIRQDELTGKYVGYSKKHRKEFDCLDEAREICFEEAKLHAVEKAKKCGCDKPQVLTDIRDEYCETYDGQNSRYIETVINVIAVGAPRFLSHNLES